jgi:N-acetylglutamate synthase
MAIKGLILRPMKITDYDPVIALWTTAGLPSKPHGRDSKSSFKHQLANPNTHYMVAEVSGEIVGNILTTHDSRKGWLNRLAVHPTLRRKGLGKALVAESERWLAKQGIGIWACQIEDWNEISMAMFEGLGYHKHTDILYFTKKKNEDI